MHRFLHRLKILSSLVWALLKAKVSGKRIPVFVGLYITNRCNLRCKYCFVNIDNRFDDPARNGYTKEEVFRLVDELYDMGTRWIFLLGGEPLMHPQIGEIVNHIAKKGMLLHILTNGTLVESRINDIRNADGVCISVDGAEEATDAMRGKGCFRRAMRGVDVALTNGMTTRVHAVLTKHSIKDMEHLAGLAKDMGFSITLSPPNYLGESEDPALMLTREDYKDFYTRYKALKQQGYPVSNSYYSIEKCLHWPISYHEYLKTGQNEPGYKPIRCVISELHGCIDAEGILFNCIQLGCLAGPNIKQLGLRKAWEELPKYRPNCESCASINTIETAAYMNLRLDIILDGFRFFFKHKGKF